MVTVVPEPTQETGPPELTGKSPTSANDLPWERNFIEAMEQIRIKRGMTQTDVAKALAKHGLPFHQQTIQRIESGERSVRLNEAFLIADALGTSIGNMTVDSTALLEHRLSRVREKADMAERRLADATMQARRAKDELAHLVGLIERLDRLNREVQAAKADVRHSSDQVEMLEADLQSADESRYKEIRGQLDAAHMRLVMARHNLEKTEHERGDLLMKIDQV